MQRAHAHGAVGELCPSASPERRAVSAGEEASEVVSGPDLASSELLVLCGRVLPAQPWGVHPGAAGALVAAPDAAAVF